MEVASTSTGTEEEAQNATNATEAAARVQENTTQGGLAGLAVKTGQTSVVPGKARTSVVRQHAVKAQ